MHTATATKILFALKELFATANRKEDVKLLEWIANYCEFDLTLKEAGRGGGGGRAGAGGPKRVAFVIDYSGSFRWTLFVPIAFTRHLDIGSMAGSKIKSAIENVQNIFQKHIYEQDSIMLMTFNGTVTTDLPLTRKGGNESFISNKISTLVRPNGGTGQIIS